METYCVSCEVRTKLLYIIEVENNFWKLKPFTEAVLLPCISNPVYFYYYYFLLLYYIFINKAKAHVLARTS
jgi:hypothetical protein